MATLVPRRNRRNISGTPARFDWMDRFFNEFFPSRLLGGMPAWEESVELLPAFDISETDDNVVVRADLPGVEVKDLDIGITGNLLTIRGERKEEHTEEGEYFFSTERKFGSFNRSITLPADVKEEGIEATFKDGVLTVSIPKAERARQKRIEVKSE